MTAPALPGLAALEAECGPTIELPEDRRDDGTTPRVWCIVRHPEFSSLTTSAPTAEEAIADMLTLIAQRRRAAHAADATAHTDEEADAA